MAFPQETPGSTSANVGISPFTDDEIAQFRAFAPAGEVPASFFAVLARINVAMLSPASPAQEQAAQALVAAALIDQQATTPATYALTALGYIRMWATLANEVEEEPPQITTIDQRQMVQSWIGTLRDSLANMWGEQLAGKILQTLLVYIYQLAFTHPLPGTAAAIALVATNAEPRS